MIQPFFPVFHSIAEDIQKSGVFSIGDRIGVHVKGIQKDPVNRTFMGFSFVRPHLKSPFRNEHWIGCMGRQSQRKGE
jgi:hypothetical protein